MRKAVTRIPQKDVQRLYDALVSRWKIIISLQEKCVLNKIKHFPQTNAFVLLSLKRLVIFLDRSNIQNACKITVRATGWWFYIIDRWISRERKNSVSSFMAWYPCINRKFRVMTFLFQLVSVLLNTDNVAISFLINKIILKKCQLYPYLQNHWN